MRRRTKNFMEDIFVIVGVLILLYLIYFFVFSKNDEPSLKLAKQDSKVELETKNEEKVSRENGFLTQIYEELKEKLFQDKSEDNTNLAIVKSNQEELSTKELYLTQRAEILSKQEERNKDLNKHDDSLKIETNHSDSLKDETVKTTEKVEAVEVVEETKTQESLKLDKPKEEVEDNNHKNSDLKVDENIQSEQKSPIEIKALEDVKTDENIEDNHHEVINIDNLLNDFEKRVYKNIDKNFDKTVFKRGEFVNIRVTILKDGKYEQLTFLNGNVNYFNKIKSQIEQAFPIQIDENLKANFPRYYRMKIDF